MLEVIACLLLGGDGNGFFERREVDFWNARRASAPAPDSGLWADSAAPPPVKKLLEDPSAANAKAYLAWQEERFRRLRAALAAVEGVRASLPVLYFARDGCRWCALQERELEGIPLQRVPAGSPLWEEYGVRVTPTLVIGGNVHRGLTSRDEILKELRRD